MARVQRIARLCRGSASLTVCCLLLAYCVGFLGARAQAQEAAPERITDQGRLMIGGGLGFLWSNDQPRVAWPHYRAWYAYATPSVTYFIRDNVGLGLTVGSRYGQQRGSAGGVPFDLRQYEAFLGVSGVFELRLGPRTGLILAPQLSAVRAWERASDPETGASWSGPYGVSSPQVPGDRDSLLLRFALTLPLVIHASESVAFGFGPDFSLQELLQSTQHRPYSYAFARPTPRFTVGASTWIGIAF